MALQSGRRDLAGVDPVGGGWGSPGTSRSRPSSSLPAARD